MIRVAVIYSFWRLQESFRLIRCVLAPRDGLYILLLLARTFFYYHHYVSFIMCAKAVLYIIVVINYTTTLLRLHQNIRGTSAVASFQICWNAFILGTSSSTHRHGTNGETLAITYVGQNLALNRISLKRTSHGTRANANTPLWAKRLFNDKIKADMKKEYAEDLKHQVEELRRKKMQKNKTGKDRFD